MKGPARRWRMLLVSSMGGLAAATGVAAATDRFIPRDPHFVVADVSQTLPDEALRGLLAQWRAAPGSAERTVALARAFIERARSQREPRYFGRAEALLAAQARSANAGADLRLLYAETLQFRHAFAPAEEVLDALLREQPHDAEARLRRGSLRLTRGDFAGARADCTQVALVPSRTAQSAHAAAGVACLAEALAGSGELARARTLLDALARDTPSLEAGVRAYLLSARAELSERAGDLPAAVDAYALASRLAPQDDAIRAALSDVLVLQGSADAGGPLDAPKPSLALLVRQAALAPDMHSALAGRARSWLTLEMARGDAIHYREAALLALAERRPAEALDAARRNFEVQRELADVRVLARAAVLARDADALAQIAQWLRATGYQDAVTTAILADRSQG